MLIQRCIVCDWCVRSSFYTRLRLSSASAQPFTLKVSRDRRLLYSVNLYYYQSLPAIDGSLFSNHHRSSRRLELPNDIWTVCKCVFHWMLWWVPSEAIFLISVFWLITFVGASNEYVGHGPWQAKRLKNKLCNTYTTTCAYWVWAVERKSPWNQTMCL